MQTKRRRCAGYILYLYNIKYEVGKSYNKLLLRRPGVKKSCKFLKPWQQYDLPLYVGLNLIDMGSTV